MHLHLLEDLPAAAETVSPPPIVPTERKSPTPEEVPEDYPLPKPEPPPVAKPLNKARINEFASLLSSAVHLAPPASVVKKPPTPTPTPTSTVIRAVPSPSRSEDQSFSSVPSASSDREERESFHTVQSSQSEQEQTKKHIDARYNEKLDDRGSIKIKTANIKALFEQKISDTNKALSQSNEHLVHLHEPRAQHKKIPVSYDSVKRHFPVPPVPVINRRQSYQDSPSMNRVADHLTATKDVVIEDKQVKRRRKNIWIKITRVSLTIFTLSIGDFFQARD